jgi:hypothetical protein
MNHEQRHCITLDLTQMIVRQLMPGGVESYEAGRVWTSEKGTVAKALALRSADKADPALSEDDPENRRNAARVLANLAILYQGDDRDRREGDRSLL